MTFAQLRAEPGLYGPVASDPTVSRLISLLASDADRAVAAIGRARKAARQSAWALAGEASPAARATPADPLVIDLDATLVTAHSEKELARPTFKRGFGFHPLCAFADHGPDGTGEPLTILLRAGNAGSNTAADHVRVIADALDQAGLGPRPGRRVLVRIDGAGSTKDTGLTNLPLHGFDANRIWCQIVALAGQITAWMGLLAHPDHQARRWEPKRLRYRLFAIPATLVRRSRRTIAHVSARHRWSGLVEQAITRLRGLPAPAG